MTDPEMISAVTELTTGVADFKRTVHRRNMALVAAVGVAMLVSVLAALGTLEAREAAQNARSASESNGRVLSLIKDALNPDSKRFAALRQEAACRDWVLHGVDGPECAAVREKLIRDGARLP